MISVFNLLIVKFRTSVIQNYLLFSLLSFEVLLSQMIELKVVIDFPTMKLGMLEVLVSLFLLELGFRQGTNRCKCDACRSKWSASIRFVPNCVNDENLRNVLDEGKMKT